MSKSQQRRKATMKPAFGKKQNVGVQNGTFIYNGPMTLDQLCKRLGISASDTIKNFLMEGKLISLNTVLDDDLIGEVCINNNLDFRKESNITSDDFTKVAIFDKTSDNDPRAPIVTIMGHVDHGKTTLIDCIRHSNITGGEAGGITQEIGAYQKVINGKKITFLDTPGHEAFTAMRSRGASVTDIVVLVVAADDGVKPQTIEALDHAKAAKVPIIVAINKCDKPGANPERVKQQLSGLGLLAEDWGGDTMMFNISAKRNQGVDELLEGILTLAELLDLKANNARPAVGSVIEATLDKKEGAKATLLVQNGTLHVGDFFAVGPYYGKVRRMTNEFNKQLKEAFPSTPVSITGLSGVPVAGDRFMVFETEAEAKDAASKRAQALIGQSNQSGASLSDISTGVTQGDIKNINLIVKADTEGTAEALRDSLNKIHVEGAKLTVLHCNSGDVSQGDIVLAQASHAVIIAFAVRTSSAMRELAKDSKVEIREYNIIYKLLEDVEAALKGTLAPVMEEVVYGHAEVRSLFKASKVGQIAGLYVTDGKLTNSCQIRVFRNQELVLKTHITSLKRFKDDAKEVLTGFECGATIAENFSLQEGDILEAFGLEERKNG
ncbi:MAG: translation initiation factor IF-2 [Eubacteriales bacterium]|nr:translation initiation factor IF-2 [Eubacteriales bacterium]